MSHIDLDGALIAKRLEELVAFSDDANCLTRLTLSPSHRKAAECVAQWMREAGMGVTFDGIGNVVGHYEGSQHDAKCVLIGSHIDTVRNAGRFDGNLGVVTGIAAVAALSRARIRLPFAIEVVAFGDEEGVRFPSTLTGSRALAGKLLPETLDDVDQDGVSRRQALVTFGADVGRLPAVVRNPSKLLAYVEVHIEQGPVLEARDLPLGVVTAINGGSRGEIKVTGMAGHAGTLPMDMRQDALVAAAEMVLAIEARARSEADLVATVGMLQVPGGAINVVPGEVKFTFDLRSPTNDARHKAFADLQAQLGEIAARRNVKLDIAMRYNAPAAPCDPILREGFKAAISKLGLPVFELPSGAGHDAMAFRGVCPIAMLFVRCAGGISHNPAEFASPDDIGLGAQVLHQFLLSFGENS